MDVEVAPGDMARIRIEAAGFRSQDLEFSYDELLRQPERTVKLLKKSAAAKTDDWDL
jgi:hypothetical protein